MLTIQDISQRFGLSKKSVRRRLDSLGPTISQHLDTGRQNAILFSDAAVSIFDRLMQLEAQDKLSPSAAIEKLKSELANGGNHVSEERGNGAQTVPSTSPELVGVLTRQIEDLRTERDRLLAIIENQEEQIRALMPGPTEPQPNGQGNGLSRWLALRVLVLGR